MRHRVAVPVKGRLVGAEFKQEKFASAATNPLLPEGDGGADIKIGQDRDRRGERRQDDQQDRGDGHVEDAFETEIGGMRRDDLRLGARLAEGRGMPWRQVERFSQGPRPDAESAALMLDTLHFTACHSGVGEPNLVDFDAMNDIFLDDRLEVTRSPDDLDPIDRSAVQAFARVERRDDLGCARLLAVGQFDDHRRETINAHQDDATQLRFGAIGNFARLLSVQPMRQRSAAD